MSLLPARLIVVVPYRNRADNLAVFAPALRSHLDAHHPGLDYEILVVEQLPGYPFNKGRLMNAGFVLRADAPAYFCFHDVDMVPDDASCDYSVPRCPTHMARYLSQRNYVAHHEHYNGGVTLFPKSDFVTVNGFSNGYWGWGSEDDDARLRLLHYRLPIDYSRRGRFTVLPHGIDPRFGPQSPARTHNHARMLQGYSYETDGLSSLDFSVVRQDQTETHTHYLVDIGRPEADELSKLASFRPELPVPTQAGRRAALPGPRCRPSWRQ